MTLHLLGDRIASRRLSYGLAVWDHGFKKSYMTLQLEIDELIVTDYSIYTDDSGRSNHRRTARLRRKTTSPQISKIDPAPSSQDDVSEILKVIFSGARPPDLPATERVFNSETGHHYQRINGPMSWDDAAKYCHNLGGHLAAKAIGRGTSERSIADCD